MLVIASPGCPGLCNTRRRVINKAWLFLLHELCFSIPPSCPSFGGLETKLPASSPDFLQHPPLFPLGSWAQANGTVSLLPPPPRQLTRRCHENYGVWMEVSKGPGADCTWEKLALDHHWVKW